LSGLSSHWKTLLQVVSTLVWFVITVEIQVSFDRPVKIVTNGKISARVLNGITQLEIEHVMQWRSGQAWYCMYFFYLSHPYYKTIRLTVCLPRQVNRSHGTTSRRHSARLWNRGASTYRYKATRHPATGQYCSTSIYFETLSTD